MRGLSIPQERDGPWIDTAHLVFTDFNFTPCSKACGLLESEHGNTDGRYFPMFNPNHRSQS